jgi:hypothetical protein
MVDRVYADVPYDPRYNPNEFTDSQRLQQAAHEENQRMRIAQEQQEEAHKLALRAKVNQALGISDDPDKQIEDAVALIAPAGKVKGVVAAMSETAAGRAAGEVATHYKESIINGARELGEALKDVAPKSPRDLAHLMFTPQNPSPERMAAFKEIAESGDINRVVRNQLGAVPYGWAGLAGSAVVGATVVTSKFDNEVLVDAFKRAHDNILLDKSMASMKKLRESDSPELNVAADMYIKLREHLEKDGFSDQNAATMRMAVQQISGKLHAGEPVVALGPRAGLDVKVDAELVQMK